MLGLGRTGCGQARRVTASCLVFFSGTVSALAITAMRHDEQDPKKPRPLYVSKKGTNLLEAAEGTPWREVRTDSDRDHHRHVC
jgi:hypothetical protein